MARVLFGPLVTAVKGSIGGVTFQNNPSGSIIRSRPHVSKASTIKQMASHSELANLLYLWQQITQDERDEWNSFAATWTKENKFGESKTLTGLNWFTSLNWWRLHLSLATYDSPPAHVLPQAPPAFALILTDSTISINFLEAHAFPENPVAVWTSLPTKKNTTSINQIRKLVMVIEAAPSDPLNITAEWEAATGLDWTPNVTFPDANIFVCLESMSASSYITSSMLCTKNSTPSEEEETIYYYTL